MEKGEVIETALLDTGVLCALADRLKITTILTTDWRHFSIIKRKDGQPYTLLP